GAPRLRRREPRPAPEGWALRDQLRSERLPERPSVDLLTDTEPWWPWTAACGPLSGLAARLPSPRPRAVTTPWGSGGSLGPPPTARSLPDRARFQGASSHQRHSTAPQLLAALVEVSKRSHRCRRPTLWGAGQRAAAA